MKQDSCKKIWILVAVLAVLLLLPVKTASAKSDDDSVQITISAAGDCTLGVDSRYNNQFNNYYKANDAAYFLKKVKSVFSKDDLTIVNLEGTLTTATKRANKEFTFKGPKKYAKILTKGSVEVVNLANNHTKDFGSKGYSDTKSTLDKYGISYCTDSNKIAYKTVKGVKVAFLGFNASMGKKVSTSTVKSQVKKAKKKGATIIITSFHWGVEGSRTPNSTQKKLAHAAINAGATLVLGHHPHVLQGVEKYKGRYIVYSLGNFCFGGNRNPSDKDTMIFQQTFTVTSSGTVKKDTNAKVIPCSISGKTSTNTFQPRVLSGSSKKRVMKKINNMSKKLGVTFSSSGKAKK